MQWQPEEIYPFSLSDYELPIPIDRVETPSFETWQELVDQIDIPKVVLARVVTYTFPEKLNPYAFLSHLKTREDTLFAYIVSPNCAFMGSTPEKLFSRVGTTIETEALAGTNLDPQALLESEKDNREFQFVSDFLETRIKPLTKRLTKSDIEIKQTGNLHHLHATFSGEIAQHVSDMQLVQTLHPTPAMCGIPQEKAFSMIESLEPFDRGLYAAPIGVISKDQSDFFVAIRSLLIRDNQLHLFSGAGIVEGSEATSEWDELNNKIAGYVECL